MHSAASQIKDIVAAFTAGHIPDYQMAAFLMAVYFRGLNAEEVRALTLAMRDSGEVLKFPRDPRPLVDKHSTGGIGDKVSLPLAPLLACLGFRVPMISGRGLGITGGTLDKLDSIPGFTTLLPAERITEIVQKVGCVICGQTMSMVPADKGLYALRDVTGTVPSIPLIVASILSKKLAEGLDALVLDVKFGRAAFMPTSEKARELAQALVTLSNECGVKTRALLTNMEVPLGRAAGNWLEVKESVACLHSRKAGPKSAKPPAARHATDHAPADLKELVIACAAHLLVQTAKPSPSMPRGKRPKTAWPPASRARNGMRCWPPKAPTWPPTRRSSRWTTPPRSSWNSKRQCGVRGGLRRAHPGRSGARTWRRPADQGIRAQLRCGRGCHRQAGRADGRRWPACAHPRRGRRRRPGGVDSAADGLQDFSPAARSRQPLIEDIIESLK